jgi:IclR family transcriptional regulator, acetate operon repressor
MTNGRLLGSVTKALLVLDRVGTSRAGLTLGEVARGVGVGKSSAHILLATLRARGWVTEAGESGRYVLGSQAIAAGVEAMRQAGIGSWIESHMERLTQVTRESVTLGVLAGDSVLVTHHVSSPEMLAVNTRPGERFALHASAIGKAFLAGMSDDEIAARYPGGPLTGYAHGAVRDTDELWREIEATRRRGYSVSVDEVYDGISAVAVPLRRGAGQVATAIALVTPSSRFDVDAAIAPLRAARDEIVRQLGYAPVDGPPDGQHDGGRR